MTNSSPLVSVVMITYGHEQLIREAIEGVLMQETDFEIELIVSNDCSPDETDKVVEAIIKNDPRSSMIKYTRHEENLGMIPNFVWALNRAKGKYIAFCEGDDYWVDPLKLHKQVKLLEDNDFVKLICSNINRVRDDSIIESQEDKALKFDIKELSISNPISTCSCIIRNDNSITKYLENAFLYSFGDYPLWFHLLSDGSKAMKLADVTAVYRVNEKGIFSGEKEIINRLKIVRNIQAIKETVELKPEIINNLDEQILENLMIALRSKDWKPELMDKLTGVDLSLSASSLIKELSEVIHAEKEGLLRTTPSKDLVSILWQRFLSKFKR